MIEQITSHSSNDQYKDVSTEEEVSEHLSEISTDHSAASIPLFQFDDKVSAMTACMSCLADLIENRRSVFLCRFPN